MKMATRFSRAMRRRSAWGPEMLGTVPRTAHALTTTPMRRAKALSVFALALAHWR